MSTLVGIQGLSDLHSGVLGLLDGLLESLDISDGEVLGQQGSKSVDVLFNFLDIRFL